MAKYVDPYKVNDADVLRLHKDMVKQSDNVARKNQIKKHLKKSRSSAIERANFAMLHNGKPVDEGTFVHEALNALEQGKLPAAQGLVLVEIQSLQKTDPVAYNAWLTSGVQAVKWQDGPISKINADLQETNATYIKTKNKAKAEVGIYFANDQYAGQNLKDYFNSVIVPQAIQQKMKVGGRGKKFFVEDVVNNVLLSGNIVYGGMQGTDFDETKIRGLDKEPGVVRYNTQALDKVLTEQVDMGHSAGDATQRVKSNIELLSRAKVLAQKENNKDLEAFYDEFLDVLKPLIERMEAIDKLQIQTEALMNSKAAVEKKFEKLLTLTASLGADQIFMIEETTPGQITDKIAKMGFAAAAEVFFAEPAGPNSWKGSKQQALLQIWENFLTGAYGSVEAANYLAQKMSSTPLIDALLLKKLSKIFQDEAFAKQIKNPRRKKEIVKKIGLSTGNKVLDTKALKALVKQVDAALTKDIKSIKKGKRSNITPTGNVLETAQVTGLELVSALNAELRDYVLMEMNYPALENRTGRFANSARVLSAEQEQAIRFTYQRSPYQVFSTARGKRPWNYPEDRDPAKIIDKAIKKLGMAKFGVVFRTVEDA